MNSELLIVTGPTAVGKTAVAVELACALDTEVISADSMQVYKHLAIGTAKPTSEELRGMRYHLVDCIEPDYQYNLGDYVRDADALIAGLHARGKLPIVCGGTGLYLRGLVQGVFDVATRDEELRGRLGRIADSGRLATLHRMLLRADPDTRIAPADRQRILRGLEVHFATGEPPSHLQEQFSAEPRYRALTFVLTLQRDTLYARIDQRVDQMIDAGLINEVRAYLRAGYSRNNPAVNALGYAELIEHIEGRLSLADAVAIMKRKSRQYAKRQLTWFRSIRDAIWVPADGLTAHEVAEQIRPRLVLGTS